MHEEEQVHRPTDCFRTAPDGNGRPGYRSLPQDGDFRTDVLQLEEEVRWLGRIRDAPYEATRTGEPGIEEAGVGFVPGLADVAGCADKKL